MAKDYAYTYNSGDPDHESDSNPLTSHMYDLHVAGDTLYAVDHPYHAWEGRLYGYLRIFDISVPPQLQLMSVMTPTGYPNGVFVSGDHAYVATDSGLSIIDVGDPELPEEIGTLPWSAVYDIFVHGDYAYMATAVGLRIVDVADRRNPDPLGMVDTLGMCHEVQVSGDFAYVATRRNGVQVVDVSDKDSPASVGGYEVPGSPFVVSGLHLQGHRLYLATWDSPVYGMDVGDGALGYPPRVMSPYEYRDVMSYCQPAWISLHTYNSIRRDLNLSYPDQTAVRAASPANDEEVLLVTAHADLGQVTGGFDTLLRRPSGLSLTVLPPASAVHLQLLDSSDVLLADYALNPLTHADAESPAEEEIVTIAETVTYLTGTAQLRLQVAGKTVASVTVSANSPTVTLLSPNGGEWLNNEAVVTWSASDPDGDDLIYTLLHSADGGGSWHALAVGWPQTSYTLTTEYLPGSTDTYFQVIASDGVNTGQDTGDGPATIPFRPPQVQIATPLDGSTLNSVQSVLLTAEARDPDQKPISDDGYGWTSDLDGALGTGRSVTIWALSPGIHQVTVSVTDADG